MRYKVHFEQDDTEDALLTLSFSTLGEAKRAAVRFARARRIFVTINDSEAGPGQTFAWEYDEWGEMIAARERA